MKSKANRSHVGAHKGPITSNNKGHDEQHFIDTDDVFMLLNLMMIDP